MAEPTPILFTHYGDDWIRGSEQVLLDLLQALDRDRFRPVLWCNAAGLAAQAASLGVATHTTPMRYSPAPTPPTLDLAAWRQQLATTRALVRQHGIRLLHANSAAPMQWLAPAARGLRLPLLCHLHAPYLLKDRFGLLLHQATLVAGVSNATLRGLVEDGMPATRLRRVPNGIDPARLLGQPFGDLRARLGIPPDTFVVGSIGSLISRKRLDVALAGFARLDLSPPARLILAGSGADRAALEAQAAELGIADRVHFLGTTDRPAEVYRAIDVNLLTSRQEAFGLVIVEAALFGVPSLGSAVDGIPEVIAEAETGLLFPNADVPALAAALQRLAADAPLRHRLGAAARQAAEARFTAARMAETLGGLYDELLAQPATALGWGAALAATGPWLRLPLTLLRR